MTIEELTIYNWQWTIKKNYN